MSDRPARRPSPAIPDPLVLILLWALLAANILMWRSLDRGPPCGDHAIHLENLHAFHPASVYGALSHSAAYYPPLAYIASYLLRSAGAPHGMAQAVFVLILMLATHAVAARLWGREAGLLAAAVAAMSPAVTFASRRYYLDLPETAMVMVTIAAYLRAEASGRARDAVMLGAAAGLCVLAKVQALLFLAGPLLYALARGYADLVGSRRALAVPAAIITAAVLAMLSPRLVDAQVAMTPGWHRATLAVLPAVAGLLLALSWKRGRRLAHLAAATLIALALVEPWLSKNAYQLKQFLQGAGARGTGPALYAGLAPNLHWYYWMALQHHLLTSLVFWSCVAAVAASAARLPLARRNAVLLLTLLVGAVLSEWVSSRMHSHESRFVLPLVPVASILATGWLARATRAGRALAAAMLGLGALQAFGWLLLLPAGSGAAPSLGPLRLVSGAPESVHLRKDGAPLDCSIRSQDIMRFTVRPEISPLDLTMGISPLVVRVDPPDQRPWPFARIVARLAAVTQGRETVGVGPSDLPEMSLKDVLDCEADREGVALRLEPVDDPAGVPWCLLTRRPAGAHPVATYDTPLGIRIVLLRGRRRNAGHG